MDLHHFQNKRSISCSVENLRNSELKFLISNLRFIDKETQENKITLHSVMTVIAVLKHYICKKNHFFDTGSSSFLEHENY